MNILQIYQRYTIMPGLQLHQLRVAAVALTVAMAVDDELSQDSIIAACLLHDMGNIIKFDLQAMAFPQFLEPEGQTYWLKVQQEYMSKYGSDEHLATMQIAREIGVSEYVLELIDAIGFGNLTPNYELKDLTKMICEYADNRVAPLGIVSLEVRLQDFENRYAHKFPSRAETLRREKAQDLARKSEQYIFSQLSIKPSAITDQALDGTITELKNFSV